MHTEMHFLYELITALRAKVHSSSRRKATSKKLAHIRGELTAILYPQAMSYE